MATIEQAEVENNDVESLVCICGNHTASDGFVAANPQGIAVPLPDALAPHPENEDDAPKLCPVYGRVYSDKVIEASNTASVAFTVDRTDGTRYKDALIAHWEETD